MVPRHLEGPLAREPVLLVSLRPSARFLASHTRPVLLPSSSPPSSSLEDRSSSPWWEGGLGWATLARLLAMGTRGLASALERASACCTASWRTSLWYLGRGVRACAAALLSPS